ncbi:rhomboid family intramembrane serine protease [Leptospira sp. GIMC2001]|uniref:rhomboid family intramembrane serine protease n=1 Tax=Leptospira sp. GIMC2001 TaxID=1513297 RepID=UPI00234B830B|nr:rhomboid family intramembrane serine protease [Leptospira sp. GIMC2001]WCL51420.1 rhomboid family intramembrane serine protease [Leptospira sp. GIMC2001]
MMSKVFWEFPLTASLVVFLFVFFFAAIFFIPDSFVANYFLSYPREWNPINWFLSSLMHGNFSHLISNLMYLFILGRAVEYKVGPSKWILFYGMALIVSALLDSIVRGIFMGDNTPVLGASGAISGLAAVAALLSPFTLRMGGVTFPFPMFLIAWGSVYTDITNVFEKDQIAHWAHLGGFFSVIITAYFLEEKDRKKLKNGFILNLVFFTLTVILFYFIEARYQ